MSNGSICVGERFRWIKYSYLERNVHQSIVLETLLWVLLALFLFDIALYHRQGNTLYLNSTEHISSKPPFKRLI